MLTRRDMVLGLAAAAAGAPVAGCRRAGAPPWPRTTTHEGVEVIELFPRGADARSPLVVAVHGMGDRPDRWVDDWRRLPARAHVALPRAFDPHGDGFSWFRFEEGMTDARFGEVVGAAEARLWRGLAKLAAGRRMIVTGFSQGGILSFAMAARHPAEVSHAFPVAGSCPGPLLPRDGARAAPIVAFHGTADHVLDVKWDREAVQAFAAQGNKAELREYDGVGHTMTPKIHADLWEAITRALPAP